MTQDNEELLNNGKKLVILIQDKFGADAVTHCYIGGGIVFNRSRDFSKGHLGIG